MKYVVFAFFIFALASSSLANTVEGDDEKLERERQGAEMFFNQFFDRMDMYLTKIRDGLTKDKKFLSLPKVELNRFMITGPSRRNTFRGLKLMYTYPAFWHNETQFSWLLVEQQHFPIQASAPSLDVKNLKDGEDYVKVFDRMHHFVVKVKEGLFENKKRKEAMRAKLIEIAIKGEVRKEIITFFKLADKYQKYLNDEN